MFITMDIWNEKNNIFNFKLAKLISLYQLLNPKTVKFRGRNIYQIGFACILVYLGLTSVMLALSSLYNWTVNIPISIDFFWKSNNTFFVIYKVWIVVCHSDDIWNCLSITRYGFTSFSNQYRHTLDHWREHLLWFTNIYGINAVMTVFLFVGITFVCSENVSPVKNYDGSIGDYGQNIVNFYFIVSDETYNSHYHMFFFAEILFVSLWALSFLMFDVLLIILCFGICCQMQIICCAFESAGHKPLRDTHPPDDVDMQDENKKIPLNKHDLIYSELKKIITEHQAVMEKYEDLLTIFQRVVLIQMFVSSFSVIVTCFTSIIGFSNYEHFKASETVMKKLFCPFHLLLTQMLMICYLFNNTNDQKDSIIFALYSSNWTEMDMKCKKLILLTMKMNNANHKKLKFTRTKIVNLFMFYRTIGDCYTVISVLVNYVKTKVE